MSNSTLNNTVIVTISKDSSGNPVATVEPSLNQGTNQGLWQTITGYWNNVVNYMQSHQLGQPWDTIDGRVRIVMDQRAAETMAMAQEANPQITIEQARLLSLLDIGVYMGAEHYFDNLYDTDNSAIDSSVLALMTKDVMTDGTADAVRKLFINNMSNRSGTTNTWFQYDSSGNITQMNQTNPDGSTTITTFSYDGETTTTITDYYNKSGQLTHTQTDQHTVNANGSSTDILQGFNANGSLQFTQTTNVGTGGSTDVTISGSGDVANFDNADITLTNGSSASIYGNNNTFNIPSGSTLNFDGSEFTMTPGGNGGFNINDPNGSSISFGPGDSTTISDMQGPGGTIVQVGMQDSNGDNMGDMETDTGSGRTVVIGPDGTVTDMGNPSSLQVTDDPNGGLDYDAHYPDGSEWHGHEDTGGTMHTTGGHLPPSTAFPSGLPMAPGSYIPGENKGFNSSMTDPIVLDLDGTGIKLTSLANSNAYFDLHGTGFAVHTGWVGSKTGILVNTGTPTSINSLFGSSNEDGFTALRAADTNGDGLINSSDSSFSNLYVWSDTNGNGVADAGEVRSLANLSISSISLNTSPVNEIVNGNEIGQVATFSYTNGTTHQVAEAYFNNSQVDSQFTGSYTLNPAALVLPNLRGYGTLPPLYIAMSLDSSLLQQVHNFADEKISNAASFSSQIRSILYQWAGVENVDRASRGQYVDARVLGFLEAFNGEGFSSYGTSNNPTNPHEGQVLNSAWNTLFPEVQARLLIQGPLASLFPNVKFNYDTDSLSGTIDINAIANTIAQNTPSGTFQAEQYWNIMTSVTDTVANGIGVSINSVNTALQNAFNTLNLPFTLSSIQAGNYVFGIGDGKVVIDNGISTSAYGLTIAGNITANDITLQANNAGDLTITLSSGDSITFKNNLFYASGDNNYWGTTSLLNQIHFSNGTSLNLNTQAGSALTFTWNGTNTNTLIGTDFGNNIFNLGTGNDLIIAGNASNTFNFSTGDGQAMIAFNSPALNNNGAPYGINVLNIGSGVTSNNLILQADAAGDLIIVLNTGDSITIESDLGFVSGSSDYWGMTSKMSQIAFSNGSTLNLNVDGGHLLNFTWNATANNTVLTGTNFGNNIFNLGIGGDTVAAGSGNNTFNFGIGDGNAIVDLGVQGLNQWGSPYGINTLNFGAGITANSLSFETNANHDLTVTLNTGDSITFKNDLNGVNSKVQSIHFSDGSTMQLDNPNPLLTFTWNGTATNTTFVGVNTGNNIFNFGAGGDTATAGSRNNTFNFGTGDGHAVVNGVQNSSGTNTLVLGTGITASNITLQADSNGDLTVTLNNNDSITFNNDLGGTNSKVQSIHFSNGTTMQLDNANPKLTFTWNGTATNTNLIGSNFGYNIFNFGPGGDTATAGNTNNTFNFGIGDGHAVVNNIQYANGTNILVLGSGATANHIGMQANSNGAVTVTLNSNDSITINNDMDGTNIRAQVNVSGGTLDIAASTNAKISGSSNTVNLAASDIVTVGGSSNTINAVAGDTIYTFGNGQTTTTSLLNIVNATSDTIGLYSSSSTSVVGNSNTITTSANDNLYVTGNTNTITAAGSNTITINGGGNTVSAANGDVINISGNGTTGANGGIDTVNMYYGTINIAANTDVKGNYSGNVINAADHDTVSIAGNANTVTTTGSNTSLTITGNNNITNAVASDTVTISGNGNTFNTTGADSVSLSGYSNTVNAASNTITMAASASATINGNSNTISASTGNSITINGGGNTATTSNGGTISISGNGTTGSNGGLDKAYISNGTVNVGASSD
ncbi:MAG TPA: hypothetical protein VFT64_05875, partial [Rickettsiales bacterium]|nr:hypothetical protein [Rickettsiales bacterium]